VQKSALTGSNHDVDPEVLRQQVGQFKEVMGDMCSDEVVALALKKSNMNLEAAIGMVMEPDEIAAL
jgi:hypothetical protein